EIAIRIDDRELAHTPRLVLDRIQTRHAGAGQASRLTLRVQGVDVLDAPVTLRVVRGRREIRVSEEVHHEVAFSHDGVAAEFPGPPSRCVKTEPLVELPGFTEIAGRQDRDGDTRLHGLLPA